MIKIKSSFNFSNFMQLRKINKAKKQTNKKENKFKIFLTKENFDTKYLPRKSALNFGIIYRENFRNKKNLTSSLIP